MSDAFIHSRTRALAAAICAVLSFWGTPARADSIDNETSVLGAETSRKMTQNSPRRIVSVHAYAAFLASEVARFEGKQSAASHWLRRACVFDPDLAQTSWGMDSKARSVLQKAKASPSKHLNGAGVRSKKR